MAATRVPWSDEPMAERLSALQLIDLVLDEGSWTSWDTPPERGPVSEAYADELAAERDPSSRAALVGRLAAHHEATTGGLTRALECGAVDEVVEPSDTRRVLLHALADLPDRRGAHHANGPL
jgi:acetyl-CoA carboxylase beta subunit